MRCISSAYLEVGAEVEVFDHFDALALQVQVGHPAQVRFVGLFRRSGQRCGGQDHVQGDLARRLLG